MSFLFEIAITIILGFAAVIYATDTLYYIAKDLKEVDEEQKEKEEDEKIKQNALKRMYS